MSRAPGERPGPRTPAATSGHAIRAPEAGLVPAGPVPAGRARVSWPALTGTGAAASFALAVLVVVCTFVAVAVPRASLGYRTQVLQHLFGATSSPQRTVLADSDLSYIGLGYLSAGQFGFALSRLAAGLQRAGLPLAPAAARWSGLATSARTLSGAPRPAPGSMLPPEMEILYRSGLARNAALVAGSLPARSVTHASYGTFQVAVTTATAARLGLHVGSRLRSAGQILVVTGIIRPVDASSSFWALDAAAAAPQLIYASAKSPPYLSTAAFISGAELPDLESYLQGETMSGVWSLPLALGGVSADQAAGLQQALQRAAFLPILGSLSLNLSAAAGTSNPVTFSLSCGLVTVLAPFVQADDAVQRALSLLFVSLAVIAAVVVMLGARLVAEHRRGEFTLMRARGASLRQVAGVALAGGAMSVLPAAAVATAAAVVAAPGPASSLSWWLAGLITGAALLYPPLLAVWWHRAARRAGSPAARRRIAAARRWVLDGTLVLAAAGGLVILRQQGLPPAGRLDLFTSLAPVLAAIPVALVIIRGYPLILGRLTRLAAGRRGAVLLVGFARGSAGARAGLLPGFALVLALAVVAFAAMARGAVARADVAASWQQTQADAIVTTPGSGPGISAAAQSMIARVPGAQHTATVSLATGTTDEGLPMPVAFIDPRQYAALTAATPAPPFPAAALARPGGAGVAPPARVPALISPGGRAVLNQSSGLWVAGRRLQVRVMGSVASIAGEPAGGQFAVLPSWALPAAAPRPAVMAVAGPRLDDAALERVARRAVPGARITLRSRILAAIAGAPLPHGGSVTFAQGAAAAAAFSLLILLLMLVLSARSRELTLARLTTMGLGAGQSRRITTVETLPAILAATAGGTVCALLLVPLVGPAVNLAAFTGSPVTVALHAEPAALGLAAGGLLLLGGLTLAIQDWLARRHGASQALRVGQ